MATVLVLVLALFAVSMSSEEDSSHDEDVEFARCVKMTKKFTMTRICGLPNLAIKCLSIETPYIWWMEREIANIFKKYEKGGDIKRVTEVMDYCYKVLNVDPINLHLTLPYICRDENVIEHVADCLCNAVKLVDDPSVAEDIEYELREVSDPENDVQYHLSENEDFVHDLREMYNNSMIHCMEYLNSVYSKRKLHFK